MKGWIYLSKNIVKRLLDFFLKIMQNILSYSPDYVLTKQRIFPHVDLSVIIPVVNHDCRRVHWLAINRRPMKLISGRRPINRAAISSLPPLPTPRPLHLLFDPPILLVKVFEQSKQSAQIIISDRFYRVRAAFRID